MHNPADTAFEIEQLEGLHAPGLGPFPAGLEPGPVIAGTTWAIGHVVHPFAVAGAVALT
jgi:hypothetical protein